MDRIKRTCACPNCNTILTIPQQICGHCGITVSWGSKYTPYLGGGTYMIASRVI